MKKSHVSLFASALIIPALAAAGWFGFPGTTADILLALNNKSAGLLRKTVETKAGPIEYLEGGEGPTVVLVHGIFARKEHWVDIAGHLVDDYHVIALDLPGFGENPVLADSAYGLREQQRNLSHVFDALDLEGVHVGANSMGALVSALLAADQPEKVASLAFIGSPLGVPSPVKSEMELALSRGEIPLLADSKEAFEARNAWLSPRELSIPSPILTTWMTAELAQADKNRRIWQAVHDIGETPNLIELAPDLTMPSLIIWCQEDRIFHVSAAAHLAAKLPRTTVEILSGCGHVPMIDSPELVASTYSAFLRNHSLVHD